MHELVPAQTAAGAKTKRGLVPPKPVTCGAVFGEGNPSGQLFVMVSHKRIHAAFLETPS